MKRRRFNQTTPSDEHLEEQAMRLRKEARAVSRLGVEREKLVLQARKAEAAARIQEWLSSPGLQPPK